MKLADIVKTVAQEMGTSDLKEINQKLKSDTPIKFRITGATLGHYGFTGNIKSLTAEGVKVFTASKVSLIRFEDIETFEKAKPRVERPVRPPKPVVKKAKAAKAVVVDLEDDEDFDDEDEDLDDDEDFNDDDVVFEEEEEVAPKKVKKAKAKPTGKSGSKFIPSFKK